MSLAWCIVLALTFARFTLGVQFQAIPAVAPALTENGSVSYAAIGTLTGAYMLPGVAVALAGGWMGQKFGDARILLFGLALMSIGGLAGWWVSGFEAAMLWRLVAGTGAVCLNVMVTKMAADWFEGRADLTTAMGVLVSSFPAGIAFSALVLPLVATTFGVSQALLLPPALAAVAFVLICAAWREPVRLARPASDGKTSRMLRVELKLVVLAGMIWGLYNVAVVGSITWLPGFLQAQGTSFVSASFSASLISWVCIFSVAAGGWFAARLRRPDVLMWGCFLGSALVIGAMPAMGSDAGAIWVVSLLGLASGPAAALIMTLPVVAARLEVRGYAMGLYFALYYGLMAAAPAVMGALRDLTGNAATPLYCASFVLLACTLLLTLFRILQPKPRARGSTERP